MSIEKVFNPKTKDEVIDLLHSYRGQAKLIAGGTDIVISLRNKKIRPKILIDISKIEELRKIEERNGFIHIGGGVTFNQLIESDLLDKNLAGLCKSSAMVGSPQIRHKGTIGGNIANGSSAADIVPPLMALESMIILESKDKTREISLEEYYFDPIKEDELLVDIKFKKPKENQVVSFSKLGLRKALAISRLTLSSYISFEGDNHIKDIKVASGALAKFPMREKEVEDYLRGKELNEKIIENAIDILKDSMDKRLAGRSTLPYKRIAISTILKEALQEGLNFRKEVD